MADAYYQQQDEKNILKLVICIVNKNDMEVLSDVSALKVISFKKL